MTVNSPCTLLAAGAFVVAAAATGIATHVAMTHAARPVAAVTCYTVGPVTVADQQVLQAVTVCVPTP